MALSFVEVACGICGSICTKSIGHYNRAMKLKANLFCSKKCFGLSRQKTIEEKKAAKAAYDKKIAATPERKAKQKEYFQKDYKANPEKYRAIRAAKYEKHLKYLQTPEYKAYKKAYDEAYRAEKLYGEFSEAAIALTRLENELESKLIKLENGITFNKSTQQRKRKWQQLNKSQH